MLEKKKIEITAHELNDDDLDNVAGGANKKNEKMEVMCPYCQSLVESSTLEYHILHLHSK